MQEKEGCSRCSAAEVGMRLGVGLRGAERERGSEDPSLTCLLFPARLVHGFLGSACWGWGMGQSMEWG